MLAMCSFLLYHTYPQIATPLAQPLSAAAYDFAGSFTHPFQPQAKPAIVWRYFTTALDCRGARGATSRMILCTFFSRQQS